MKKVLIFILLTSLIVSQLSSSPAYATCDESNEPYPLRPYPGNPCDKRLTSPNTVVCADRPNPIGERTYTVTCPSGPGTLCIYTAPPTTFSGKFKVAIHKQVQVPFTSYAEYDRPDYSDILRNDKTTYLADYLGGSGSVYYDTQPLKSTDQPLPTPQQILDQSSAWQRLMPKKVQDNKKLIVQKRANENDIHDYIAFYGSSDNPSPRETRNGTPHRITQISPSNKEAWKYIPAFSLEDASGKAYLNIDQVAQTSPETIYIPHLVRLFEATQEIQHALSPEQTDHLAGPPPISDSEPAALDPFLPNDETENPGVDAVSKDSCDLTITGFSPADFVYTETKQDIESADVSWTETRLEKLRSQTPLLHGSSFTVHSEFPGETPDIKNHYLLSRIPYIRQIWEGLYHNGNGVFTSLIPHNFWGSSAHLLDYPAEGTSPYSFPDTKAEAGNGKEGGSANFYFRFLYRLNQVSQNVIKSTNPELSTSSITTGGNLPPLPEPTDVTCKLCSISSKIKSQLLVKIYEAAATTYKVPAALLVGISSWEGPFVFDLTDEEVKAASIGGGKVTNCETRISSTGAKGPMQWIDRYWQEHKDAVKSIDPSRTPEVCNIIDSIYASARKLAKEHTGIEYPDPVCYGVELNQRGGRAYSCSEWDKSDVYTAGRQYLGYCGDDYQNQVWRYFSSYQCTQ